MSSLPTLFIILVSAIWVIRETRLISNKLREIDELRSKLKALQEEEAQLEADSRRYVDDEAMR